MKRHQTDTDDLFAVLADSRRRFILRHLRRHGSITFAALSTELANQGPDIATARLELHHDHLPKLEAAGFVTFDPSTGLIDPAALPDDRFAPFLEHGASRGEMHG